MSLISVLICTRHRPAELARCLPTVLANDHPSFEIVLVDQSISDETEHVVASMGDERLHYWRQDATGLSTARNAATDLATGDILAFTDDDCTVPSNWLSRIAGVFLEEPSAGLVFGALEAIPHDEARFLVPAFNPPAYRRISGAWATRQRSEAGGNMAVRSSVFDAVGRFDTCLGLGGLFGSAEDSDLTNRALRAGFSVIHDPASSVKHWGARAYADGSARRLILDTALSSGALIAKELRFGNPSPLWALYPRDRQRRSRLDPNTSPILRRSPLQRVNPLAVSLHLARGFWLGLRQPLNRPQGVWHDRRPRPHGRLRPGASPSNPRVDVADLPNDPRRLVQDQPAW